MFGSPTITGHLSRGVIGGGALTGAVVWSSSHPMFAMLAVLTALAAFRGCPMCWTIGLVETISAKVSGRSTRSVCADGCAPATHRPDTGVER